MPIILAILFPGSAAPRRGLLAESGHLLRVRLRAKQATKTLICRGPHEGFQTQPDRLCVGRGAKSRFRRTQELRIEVERLLHEYDYAILIWPYGPDATTPARQFARRRAPESCNSGCSRASQSPRSAGQNL